MNDIVDIVVVMIRVGIKLALACVALVYVAYAVESHCWNPMGCIDPKQVAEADNDARILWCQAHEDDRTPHCADVRAAQARTIARIRAVANDPRYVH